jgi:hypothetical protein
MEEKKEFQSETILERRKKELPSLITQKREEESKEAMMDEQENSPAVSESSSFNNSRTRSGKSSVPQTAGIRTGKGPPKKKVLTPTQKEDIKKTYQLFDTDGSGSMDTNELAVALWALGFSPESGETVRIVAEFLGIDEEEATEKEFDPDEFLALITELLVHTC